MAVTLGLVVLGHLFGSVIGTLPFGPVGFGVALGAFLIFVCVCTVWQFVGIWRSAGSHMQSTGRRLWGSLARVAVVLGALRAVYDFNTVIGPMLAESGRIATRTENIAPHQLRLLRDGTEVELAGAMPLGTADALRRLLDAAPGVQVVHLNSVGGRVSEGYEIYQLVRDRKLITYTATNCMSACTIAFLGGVQRLLSTRASLGFHSISFAGIDQRLIPEINAELRQTLLSHGAPAWFVEKALTTNADSMWYPTKGELTAAKIVTGVVDPDQFGFSGIRNWRDQESLERGLLEIPLYALVRDNDPEMFKRVAGKFAEGVKLGRSVIEITRDVQSILQQQIIPKYLLAAPDGVLLRYWRTQLAEMEHLRRTDPAHCIAYLFPQFRGKNFKLNDFIPEKLLQEDIVLLTELVREAIKNPVASKAIDFEEEVARVFERISVKFPRAQELLSEPLKYTNEPDALCSAFLAFYFDVMSLPTERSAAVMRAVLDPGR